MYVLISIPSVVKSYSAKATVDTVAATNCTSAGPVEHSLSIWPAQSLQPRL